MGIGKELNRREFMQRLGGAGFLMMIGAALPLGAEDAPAGNGQWILASDTHVPADPANEYRGFRPYDQFVTGVKQFQQAEAEGCIITGDIARLEGLDGDYANMFEIARPLMERFPVYLCPGNHDDRSNLLRHALEMEGRAPVSGKLVHSVDSNGVRFLMLDTLMFTNKTPGLLGKEQRTWLRNTLGEEMSAPTVLFFHHTLGDGDGDLLDGDRLFRTAADFPQVKAMVFGHSHAYSITEREGIHLINLPALGYNFSDNESVGWVLARFSPEGVDLTMKAIGGNRDLHDQVQSVRWD